MNKPSGKISPEENSKVFEMLGDRRQSLSTAVVQLLLANQNSTRQWQLVVTGVACFVKDSVRRGYFIQVFDMDSCQRIWEQELYNEMIYKNPTSTFHTFEGDSTTVGLSFADNREAEEFKAAVNERLDKRRTRIQQRRMSQNTNNQTANSSYNVNQATSKISPTPIIVHDISLDAKREDARERKFSNAREKYFTIGRKKNKEKQKLTKLDIGTPSSFVHVTGVKPSTQGFQMVDNTDQIDPLLREFLQVAGLSESILSNPEQKEEIYRFVEDNNVLESMEQKHKRKTTKMQSSQKPKVAPKPSIKVQTTPSFPPPPPPLDKPHRIPMPTQPSTLQGNNSDIFPPPPPILEQREIRNPPSLQSHSKISSGVPPPPPPPPPPMPSNLTESKPSIPATPNKPSVNGAGNGNAKVDLMEAIRKRGGIQGGGLKHVEENGRSSTSSSAPGTDGSLVNVLQGALSAIKNANQSDSSDDDSTDDDEWSEEDC